MSTEDDRRHHDNGITKGNSVAAQTGIALKGAELQQLANSHILLEHFKERFGPHNHYQEYISRAVKARIDYLASNQDVVFKKFDTGSPQAGLCVKREGWLIERDTIDLMLNPISRPGQRKAAALAQEYDQCQHALDRIEGVIMSEDPDLRLAPIWLDSWNCAIRLNDGKRRAFIDLTNLLAGLRHLNFVWLSQLTDHFHPLIEEICQVCDINAKPITAKLIHLMVDQLDTSNFMDAIWEDKSLAEQIDLNPNSHDALRFFSRLRLNYGPDGRFNDAPAINNE